MSPTIALALDLISRASITPQDAGCQPLIAERLRALDFHIEPLRFGEVDNLWARRGSTEPLFVFAGHTDVVPTGPLTTWQFPPFNPVIHEGFLYGRGAADMKGSLAAMVTATERFIESCPHHRGSIAFLLTSDEEGPSINGTTKVIKHLEARQEKITWCIVGEPSSVHRLGDVIKVGRRGSLNGEVLIHGTQGHIAYPQLADNPIHRSAVVLHALCQMEWDKGNAFFPPTSFQISNIHGGTGATNVIPNELQMVFNFRYSNEVTHTQLQEKIQTLLDAHIPRYTIKWEHSGFPFLTQRGSLLTAVEEVIQAQCGYPPELSTGGGTSDGRFISPTGAEVLEVGPNNATIHKIDERVNVEELETLSVLYSRILQRLLG